MSKCGKIMRNVIFLKKRILSKVIKKEISTLLNYKAKLRLLICRAIKAIIAMLFGGLKQ